ncbi:MAG TPA: hypothetical protein VOA87_20465 [Thermoanaerobaculia bacterium]|nr:hypothetical protein [Thermoanaerobaculia bacterium]
MRLSFALALPLLLGATLAPARPIAPPAQGPPGLFRFARLNHGYSETAAEAVPITQGPLTVRLSSPRNQLILKSNQLLLQPGLDGSHNAELRVQFLGKGWLVADVDLSGVRQRFEEEVLVPPQEKVLAGRVRIARALGGGYLITPERLPAQIAVQIRSRLANDVVNLCDRLSILPLTSLDCEGLDRSLSTAYVPLPPAGDPFYLAPGDLTAADRQRLELYLEAAARQGARGARR